MPHTVRYCSLVAFWIFLFGLFKLNILETIFAEQGNDFWHDYESLATKICSLISSKWKLMFESHVKTCIDWTSFDFFFSKIFEQSATENNHLQCYWSPVWTLPVVPLWCDLRLGHCSRRLVVIKLLQPHPYWPTIHNLILKFCPEFQVLSSHFSKVDILLNEHWEKRVHIESISNINVKWTTRWYILSGLDILLEQSENENPACKQSVQGCKKWQSIYLCLVDQYEPHGSVV